MERAQLFTRAGELVATVTVEMATDGKWPNVVTFQGRHFVLQNGRYVLAPEVLEATVAAEG